MAPDPDIPRAFTTMRSEAGEVRAIEVRAELDLEEARGLLEQLAAAPWGELYHAYGPATDVPGQLAAVIVGDEDTREEAWWNLWGNIHHQGTIYEATVPAVPLLFGLADWVEHPDRVEALLMLRAIGAAEGIYVWHPGEEGALVTDEDEQTRLYPALRAALSAGAARRLDEWRSELQPVRRALLWLLSVLPDMHARHDALIAETLPEQHRRGWDLEVARSADSQEDADAVFALEAWIHDGFDR